MEQSVATSVILPLSLFIIMLGMGMSLTPGDFRRVVLFPKAMIAGLLNQLILLPIFGFALATAFALEPVMAVGLMLLAACPGGVTSNLITHVSRGDTALSITLTAINSFVTVLTIPLIVAYSLDHFLGASQTIDVPVLKMIGQIFAITILPVSLGMVIRHLKPAFADRMDRPSRIASSVIFLVILVGIIAKNIDLLKEHFLSLSGVTLSLNLSTMLLGWIVALILGLKLPQKIAISIESGIQNGTLAIVIATTILGPLLDPILADSAAKGGDTALPAGIYSLLMFVTGGAMMIYFGAMGRGDFDDEDGPPQ